MAGTTRRRWWAVLIIIFMTLLPGPEALKRRRPQHQIRVLCFGDSLTAGFYDGGRNYHAYSIKLQQLLDEHYKGSASRASVHEHGVSGERVLRKRTVQTLSGPKDIDSMRHRLQHHLSLWDRHHFDFVLILGGINDITSGAKPANVVAGLKEMWDEGVKHGAQVIAMTLMETKLPEDDPRQGVWRAVNTMINAALAPELSPGDSSDAEAEAGQGSIHLFDLKSKIPLHTATKEFVEEIWDDGLHLTPAGYDLMGRVIFEGLKPYLPAPAHEPPGQ